MTVFGFGNNIIASNHIVCTSVGGTAGELFSACVHLFLCVYRMYD